MPWLSLVAYVFGGAFLANAVPHVVSGLMGKAFQTPFAKPPGKGLSSPLVNVVWGFANFVVGYVLVMLHLQNPRGVADIAAIALGVLATGLFLGAHFGKVKGNT